MILKNLFILLISIIHEVRLLDSGARLPENYGQFVVDHSTIEKCKGPKTRSVADFNTTVVKSEPDYIVEYKMTFFEQTRFDEVNMIIYFMKGNRKNVLYSYKVDKPCKHFALAKIIEDDLHAKNCVVNKGNYTYLVNYTEYSKIFVGHSFFYGEYILKVVVLSSRGNIMCVVMHPTFKKKI